MFVSAFVIGACLMLTLSRRVHLRARIPNISYRESRQSLFMGHAHSSISQDKLNLLLSKVKLFPRVFTPGDLSLLLETIQEAFWFRDLRYNVALVMFHPGDEYKPLGFDIEKDHQVIQDDRWEAVTQHLDQEGMGKITLLLLSLLNKLAMHYKWGTNKKGGEEGIAIKFVRYQITKEEPRKNLWHHDARSKETFLIELVPFLGNYSKLMFAKNPLAPPHLPVFAGHISSHLVENWIDIPYQENQMIAFTQDRGEFIHCGPTLMATNEQEEGTRVFLQIKRLDEGW